MMYAMDLMLYRNLKKFLILYKYRDIPCLQIHSITWSLFYEIKGQQSPWSNTVMNIQTDFGRMSLALFVQSLPVLSSALASLSSGNMSRKVFAEFM